MSISWPLAVIAPIIVLLKYLYVNMHNDLYYENTYENSSRNKRFNNKNIIEILAEVNSEKSEINCEKIEKKSNENSDEKNDKNNNEITINKNKTKIPLEIIFFPPCIWLLILFSRPHKVIFYFIFILQFFNVFIIVYLLFIVTDWFSYLCILL